MDLWIHNYVQSKLERALQPAKIALVIQLLHGNGTKGRNTISLLNLFMYVTELVVDESRTHNRRVHEHRRVAWGSISQSIPEWVKLILGAEQKAEMVFQCLQYPVLNKQVICMIFVCIWITADI